MQNIKVGPYLSPVVLMVGVLAVLWAPWLVLRSSGLVSVTESMSLKDAISDGMPDRYWFWASCVGAVIIVVGAFLVEEFQRRVTILGGLLLIAYPVKTAWEFFRAEAPAGISIRPGWGLYLTIALGLLIMYLGSRVGREE